MKKNLMKGLAFCVLMLCGTVNADAQLGGLFNKVISAVTGQDKVSEANLTGTWVFSGSGIELTSTNNNILKNLGGTAASEQVEKKLDSYLSKVGITKGEFSMTFAEDKTLIVKTAKGNTREGTYEIVDGNVVIKMGNFNRGITCQTDITSKTLKLMVKADMLMNLASTLSNMSANASLKSINALLQNYSGINVGMQFTREQ